MPDLTDDEQTKVLGEVLGDQLKIIQEGIANLPTRPEFRKLADDVAVIKSDIQKSLKPLSKITANRLMTMKSAYLHLKQCKAPEEVR